jgi:hypothetical protein
MLYEKLETVAKTSFSTLLYCDTDSIIYAHPKENNPLKTGPHLGDLTDELKGYVIVEFASGGNKQYGLLYFPIDEPDNLKYILKVRGITLNNEILSSTLSYENFKKSVLKYGEKGELDLIFVNYPRFIKPSIKDGQIISTSLTKVYKCYVGKGIVTENYHVRPFGYS